MSSPEIRSYGSADKDLFLVGNRKNSFNSQSNIVNTITKNRLILKE